MDLISAKNSFLCSAPPLLHLGQVRFPQEEPLSQIREPYLLIDIHFTD